MPSSKVGTLKLENVEQSAGQAKRVYLLPPRRPSSSPCPFTVCIPSCSSSSSSSFSSLSLEVEAEVEVAVSAWRPPMSAEVKNGSFLAERHETRRRGSRSRSREINRSACIPPGRRARGGLVCLKALGRERTEEEGGSEALPADPVKTLILVIGRIGWKEGSEEEREGRESR